MAGYLVTESVPLAYDRRTWPDGERSPGVKQITMFDKRSDIDDAQFFARWHGSHTPLTFEVHPVCLYVRHAVARAADRRSAAAGAASSKRACARWRT